MFGFKMLIFQSVHPLGCGTPFQMVYTWLWSSTISTDCWHLPGEKVVKELLRSRSLPTSAVPLIRGVAIGGQGVFWRARVFWGASLGEFTKRAVDYTYQAWRRANMQICTYLYEFISIFKYVMYVYFCDCIYFLMSFYLCAGAVSGMTRHHQKALVYTYILWCMIKTKYVYIYIYSISTNKDRYQQVCIYIYTYIHRCYHLTMIHHELGEVGKFRRMGGMN